MKQIYKIFIGLILFIGLTLFTLTASAELLYYNIVPHSTGSDCQSAKNYLTSIQLYNGTSQSGVPAVTDNTLTYTVESYNEATELCSQVGGTPAELLPESSAFEYQPSAHPWMKGSITVNPEDDTCAVDNLGNNHTYLQLAGHCNP